MPVPSLPSSAITWPNRQTVDEAVRRWAAALVRKHPVPRILAIGYFGSYARGDWGFGSDVDLLVIVEDDPTPFIERALRYQTLSLPVPADLFVYTRDEWQAIQEQPSGRHIAREVVWVWPEDEQGQTGEARHDEHETLPSSEADSAEPSR